MPLIVDNNWEKYIIKLSLYSSYQMEEPAMKRRLLIGLCLICMLMNLLAFSVSAETSGDCGDNSTWSLSGGGVLTISGTGAIRDYIYEGANLWR